MVIREREPSTTFLYTHRKFLVVGLIATCGTACALVGMTSWKFAAVGDELPFFYFAKRIAEQHLLVNPLGMYGVYGEHQVLGSYVQAIFLVLFGSQYAVWKFSGVIVLLPSVIFLYLFVRPLYGRNPALISALLLAFSKYLCNFFKIGYIHSLCLFLLVFCLYLAGELLRVPTRAKAIKLGIGLGISFFVVIGPVFPFLLLPFGVALLHRKGRQAIPLLAIVALVLLAFISIGLLTTPADQRWGGLTKTSVHREFDSKAQVLINIGRNFLLFWQNFDYLYNHFVEGPYLDLISRWAALFGIVLCLLAFRQTQGLLLFLWIMLCLGIGISNPYWYTPSTRGIFFIPYGVIFASLGLEFLRRNLRRFGVRWVLPLVLVAIIGLNIYEAHIGIFRKAGYSRTALILRELVQSTPQEEALLLVHSPGYQFDVRHVLQRLPFFGIPASRFAHTHQLPEACATHREKLIAFTDDPIHPLPELCAHFQDRKVIVMLQGGFP
ncbi:hypothetical protein GF339_23335 [candidate division KSB3 bacterium]|uniref:Glycosyltransferase RgtA/B/C/D-like domain-containing protein n=1 Tax=candidate division KSB3 bacterium TaxID=2044937 RepID=A0A9D5Q8J4_9BACT|nr:hypothetical protein [candidate division KSB3 bacterium]MBD3327538.1 hypothetical protein [candidate division KSB3 bacterium]